jgi:hypothetical protein
MTLTATEVERGWVEHVCDQHGFLAAMTPKAQVQCRCGKVARILRHGRVVNEQTLKPTAARARSLNGSGHPHAHACGDCGEDFHGASLLKRHRVGRGACGVRKVGSCCSAVFVDEAAEAVATSNASADGVDYLESCRGWVWRAEVE